MTKTFSVPLAVLLVLFSCQATQEPTTACYYWVATDGDDAHLGTFDQPWATLQHASRSVPDDNCTVWLKPGIYFGGHRLNRRFETPTLFKSMFPYRTILENTGPVVSISGGKNITLEGFEIRHTGPGADPLLVAIDGSQAGWSENIILRNNIIHDSYNNDLLKIYNGARFVTIEDNLFYNQGASEEQMDVNSVTDVVIQDNIFLNDYPASGRADDHASKQFIVIKDSNGAEDGLLASRRITVQRNIFLNWQGQGLETFVQVGLDGKPYSEAIGVHIQNNLLIGNSPAQVGAPLGVRGALDVYFVNNTVVGDLPAQAYAMRVNIAGQNPPNEYIYFVNNIWSDPTGTMGADLAGHPNEFSDGDPAQTENLFLDNNLYWNGRAEIPAGDLVTPMIDDHHRIVADPLLVADQAAILPPHWDGTTFASGAQSIREEFVHLARSFATLPPLSPAIDRADPAYAPSDDLLGRQRRGRPDLGAYEH